MKKTISTSTLVFSGLALMTNASAYTPVAKARPTRDFIESTYLVKTPVGFKVSGRKSEERKAILNNIRNIREQIRLTNKEMDGVDKLCNDCIQGIVENTERKLSRLQLQRAQELHVPAKYVKVDEVAKRKGIVIIQEFEI